MYNATISFVIEVQSDVISKKSLGRRTQMKFNSSYLQSVYDGLESRNAEQKEFLQAVAEVLESLEPVVAANPKLEELGIIERIGSKFLVWFLVLFCAGVMFSFLESATAASGGFFHELNAVLKNVSKGFGLICLFLGIYAWLRGALRSFRTYREIETPGKKFFKKIHQFKYELLDGVVDAPSESDDNDEDEDEDEPEPTPRQRRQPQRRS